MQCSSLRAEAFLVFDKGSQPTLGQQITDMRPTVGRQSADCRQKIFVEGGKRQSADSRPTVGRLSSDCRSTVVRLSVDCRPTVGRLSADCWPTVGRQFFGGAVLHFFRLFWISQKPTPIIAYNPLLHSCCNCFFFLSFARQASIWHSLGPQYLAIHFTNN